MSSNVTKFTSLPVELYHIILSYVPISERMKLRQVSKVFKREIERNTSKKDEVFEIQRDVTDSDVPKFRYMKNIKLLKPSDITDVSPFSHCHTLILDRIPNVKDISPLKNVSKLSFNISQRLSPGKNNRVLDVSSLKNVPDLEILDHSWSCERNDVNFSTLTDNYTLTLSGCYIKDVSSYSKVHTLNLIDCEHIVDVSPLRNVSNLCLGGCTDITDVSSLGKVNTLDIRCTNILDISTLGNVNDLIIERTQGMIFPDIIKNKSLMIQDKYYLFEDRFEQWKAVNTNTDNRLFLEHDALDLHPFRNVEILSCAVMSVKNVSSLTGIRVLILLSNLNLRQCRGCRYKQELLELEESTEKQQVVDVSMLPNIKKLAVMKGTRVIACEDTLVMYVGCNL